MILRKISKSICFLIAFLIILQGNWVMAKELSFTEAVEHALQYNSDLHKLVVQVESLERDLDQIRAGQSWQIDLNANSTYQNQKVTGLAPNTDSDTDFVSDYGMQVSFDKTYPFGLTIRPELNFDLLKLNSDFSMKIAQKLFPLLPTEAEKAFFKTEIELQKAYLKLEEEKAAKVQKWIESYLNLVRLNERHEILQASKDLAEEALKEVKSSYQIGDASQQQVLSAELDLKQAEYELKNTAFKFDQSKDALRLELGLQLEDQVLIAEDADFIRQFTSLLTDFSVQLLTDLDQQMSQLEKFNYQLLANQMDRKVLEQELIWLERENKTDIDLNGNYNSKNDEWSVGVNLSYQLYDGGQWNLKLDDKEEQIQLKEEDYFRQYDALKLEMDKLNDQLTLDQMGLAQEEMKLEKMIFDEKVAQQQYELGLIDQLDLKEKELRRQEAEVNLKSAQDRLLLSKLKLVSILMPDELLD